MGFRGLVRDVRWKDLRYDHRVTASRRLTALRRCVRAYHPLGFDATVSFLEKQAGRLSSEDGLLRAVELMETSHALWTADVRRYREARKQAKRLSQRFPDEIDPAPARYWYGARREGALYAAGFWRQHRFDDLIQPDDRIATDLAGCVEACVATGGRLTSEEQQVLGACLGELETRQTEGVSLRDRHLLRVAWFVQDADRGRPDDGRVLA
ncbi:hypothetical protein [Amycolatopsis sp. H20-H5]|uniref:hypothetical protein n=1 Tax=Amycolatopsis sp. H20-H5 TaxID=3046309 RepID=UPI002DBF187A|nr:hypothetical protein [Amycolatopsis sp. H20-H5]MEC3978666.1 hypothetical protein [Amycolatopsis sp. H20-H5]